MRNASKLTLTDVCDPLFLAICRINRVARTPAGDGAPALKLHATTVRAQIETAFREMSERAAESGLIESYEGDLQLALKCFADLMMVRGGYAFSDGWEFLSRNECAAPGEFYIEQIRATLDDASEAASERLAVYHVCLCMGCEGHYYPDAAMKPEFQELLRNVSQRIEARSRAPAARMVCKDAYEGVFRDRMPPPPGTTITVIAVVAVALVSISLLFSYGWTAYFVSDLNGNLKTVIKAAESKKEKTAVVDHSPRG